MIKDIGAMRLVNTGHPSHTWLELGCQQVKNQSKAA
jgi:hypothetical protein